MGKQNHRIPESIRPYLNEIAERLWSNRAAVMVGSGFSKNAGKSFPDWNQLGDLFYEKAHGVKPKKGSHKYLNVLRLAEEVQASIGRPALEKLLRSHIPDLDYTPSKLHVDLLELPWVDIFTTNYDTLLERASTNVIKRKYEPVLNKEDLPNAVKPRIIKLHGSFPSERPFIITEEDYRRYPHDYAPFVNTVRQSMLENTLCLIGFSGDDPNFLQWLGWIRDNMGKEKTQKIYLIGLFDFSSAKLQLLAQRGIVVVDLSIIDGVPKNNHKSAFEVFIDFINSSNPDLLNWPKNNLKSYPPQGSKSSDEVFNVVQTWKKQREMYPGWLILPHSNRQKLWNYTQFWINYQIERDDLPRGLDILYTYELIWRLEKCLYPLFQNVAEFAEKLIQKYSPYDNSNAGPEVINKSTTNAKLNWKAIEEAWLGIALALLRFYREEGDLNKWAMIESLLNKNFVHLSDEQKEQLQYEIYLFHLFSLELKKAKNQLSNWNPNESQPYWIAKRIMCLAELGFVDTSSIKIIQDSLVATKSKDNAIPTQEYLNLSKEAYQIFLYKYIFSTLEFNDHNRLASSEEVEKINEIHEIEIKHDSNFYEIEEKNDSSIITENFNTIVLWEDLYNGREGEYKKLWEKYLNQVRTDKYKRQSKILNDRLDELSAISCDPGNELKLFELVLEKPYQQKYKTTVKREFDIGRVSQVYQLSKDEDDELTAYAFLRFCEDVGLPFRIGNYTMAAKSAVGCLERISNTSPFWAILTLLRSGEPKAVDKLFSREAVSNISRKKADNLTLSYLATLEKAKEDIQKADAFNKNNYAVRLAEVLPEIMSRLCVKASFDVRNQILEFIATLYGSEAKVNYRNIQNLLSRLLKSFSTSEKYSLIPRLLEIPYPGELNGLYKDEFINPFKALNLDDKPTNTLEIKIPINSIESLIIDARSKTESKRSWAISSLVSLYDLGLIPRNLIQSISKAIWSDVDHFGLPTKTEFFKFVFLKLPCPKDINYNELFKKYIFESGFPIQNNADRNSVNMTRGHIPIINEIIGAYNVSNEFWSQKDISLLLTKVVEWWDQDKGRIKEPNIKQTDISAFGGEEFTLRFNSLIRLISKVIAPNSNIQTLDPVLKVELSRMLNEMRNKQLATLNAEVKCLHIYPESRVNILNRITTSLLYTEVNTVIDALNAISSLIVYEVELKTDSAESLAVFCNYIQWRPLKFLVYAFKNALYVLDTVQNDLLTKLNSTLLIRLEGLLIELKTIDNTAELTFDELLELKIEASKVASRLYNIYEIEDALVPKVLEKWKEIGSSNDDFAEINNTWQKLT